MQLTLTVDTAAIATRAGVDPSALDHWLSANQGRLDQMVGDWLYSRAAADGTWSGGPNPGTAAAAGADTTGGATPTDQLTPGGTGAPDPAATGGAATGGAAPVGDDVVVDAGGAPGAGAI